LRKSVFFTLERKVLSGFNVVLVENATAWSTLFASSFFLFVLFFGLRKGRIGRRRSIWVNDDEIKRVFTT